MLLKRLVIMVMCLCFSLIAWSKHVVAGDFVNVRLPGDANNVYALFQSSDGIVWFGTNQGLCFYDGYDVHRCYVANAVENTHVYSIVGVGDLLYLGSDYGLLAYNMATDRYEAIEGGFPHDIRSLALDGDGVWIGSLNGLFFYDFKAKSLRNHSSSIPNRAVYAIRRAENGDVFVGTYDGLCRYDNKIRRFVPIPLYSGRLKGNRFVNSLVEDRRRNCLWIGTEGALLRYGLTTQKLEVIPDFVGNTVKSLALKKDSVLIAGTDNGLFFYSEDGIECYRHDSRMANSLTSNVVWSVLQDVSGNVWAGTESDISVAIQNDNFEIVTLSSITGRGDGNRIHNIFRDSKGFLWIGGTNGIIRYDEAAGSSKWYMMGDGENPLAHNRIRGIYEDRSGSLWIASDGSINRYDYGQSQFVRYFLRDATGAFNANWAYGILEDAGGRMWVGSYLGGVLAVDRQKLITSGVDCVADVACNAKNGLSSNYVNQLVQSVDGNKWCLLYKSGFLCRIDANNRVLKVDVLGKVGAYPEFLIVDPAGGVWCGVQRELVKIEADGEISKRLRFPSEENIGILSMTWVGKDLWVSTSKGIWVADSSGNFAHLPITGKNYTSIYYDRAGGCVWIGGADELVRVLPSIVGKKRHPNRLRVTDVRINDAPIEGLDTSVRRISELHLASDQNHIVVEFSDFDYALNNKKSFEYRLKGVVNDWVMLPDGSNAISMANLGSGKYVLEVRPLDVPDEKLSLPIVVDRPWYFSWWAIVVYIAIGVALLLWFIDFSRLKIRLKMERIERDKTIESVKSRMDFMTDVSHELKTPLSMILGPVSKLLTVVKDPDEKKSLDLIHKNAMKLNALIHRAIEANRTDDNSDNILIYSHIEAINFFRSIFYAFQDAYPEKTLVFTTTLKTLMINADVIKLESVVNNIVSNACKYSDADGRVELKVEREGDNLVIEVSDNGDGIPEGELNLVFQRLYQSSVTVGIKEGTGIGLYLAKSYVEMHEGTISVASKVGEGSTFRIVMPVVEDAVAVATVIPPDDGTKKKVLIVDDNVAISKFISDLLSDDYLCATAFDGKSAIEICGKFIPDLLIADLMMPVMDGLEMCRRIKQNKRLAAVPIIMLTAKDDRQVEEESIKLGIDTFIAKPFDAPMLMARVKQLLGAKEIIRANVRVEEITSVSEIEAESVDERQLASITKIIEDNISVAELNVGFVCQKTDMSQKQLYRLVKKYIGVSPVDYIRQIRMKKAAMLLMQKKFTVSEVMYMVGFSSASYFSKCFSLQFGSTPKQYAEKA